MGHGVVYSYHFLLALVELDRSFLKALCGEDKIPPLLQSLQRQFPPGTDSISAAAELSLTDGAKNVVRVMLEESTLMGRPQVEKGHIWTAIIRQSPPVSDVLTSVGITLEDVRSQYLKELYSTSEPF